MALRSIAATGHVVGTRFLFQVGRGQHSAATHEPDRSTVFGTRHMVQRGVHYVHRRPKLASPTSVAQLASRMRRLWRSVGHVLECENRDLLGWTFQVGCCVLLVPECAKGSQERGQRTLSRSPVGPIVRALWPPPARVVARRPGDTVVTVVDGLVTPQFRAVKFGNTLRNALSIDMLIHRPAQPSVRHFREVAEIALWNGVCAGDRLQRREPMIRIVSFLPKLSEYGGQYFRSQSNNPLVGRARDHVVDCGGDSALHVPPGNKVGECDPFGRTLNRRRTVGYFLPPPNRHCLPLVGPRC